MKKALVAVLIPALLLVGCIKEVEAPQMQDGLHEVVFHAGWEEPETRTELQEDGSVWWSPGDTISLFIGSGENGGYKLISENTEPAAKADFVGQIGENPTGVSYFAVYPYSKSTWVNGGYIGVTIPSEQVAKEGTFEKDLFISYAVSDNESLLFHNLCGGIKFSVAHEGIKRVEIASTGENGLCGDMVLYPDGVLHYSQGTRVISVVAPADYFETGKYYYAVVAASEEYNDEGHTIQVTYYTDDATATAILPGCQFKRSVFKRLYEADKDLKFKKIYDRVAYLPFDFLPESIDKTTITEAFFHISDSKTTDIVVSDDGNDSAPIYFEMDGTTAHFYTEGEVYKCYNLNFEDWSSLRSLDLSMFDVSEVKRFYPAFQGCRSLQSINLSSFDTSDVTDFGSMFSNCESLKDLDITHFDTSKAISMSGMFYNCFSLKELDVSKLDVSNVSNMSSMFEGCSSLKHLDVSKFDVTNVTDMSRMFAQCSSLTRLDVSSWNTSICKSFDDMFFSCASLIQLDVSSWDTSSCTRVNSMFSGCQSIETLDVSHFDTSNVSDFNSIFTKCWNLQTIDISNWNMSKAGYTRTMFADCKKLREIDLSGCELGELIMADGMFLNCSSLETITFPMSGTPKLQNMENMFSGCLSLTNISFNGLSTSNVTNMGQLFTACSSLKSLDLSSFETANVTSMYRMFMGCSSLTKLDLSNFDTHNVSDMDCMFSNCFSLSDLNLSSFTTTSIEHASGLLEAVGNLSRFDLGNHDWSSINLTGAFYKVGDRVSQCHIRCTPETKNKIISIREDMGTDSRFIWYDPEDTLPAIVDGRDPELYYSTDYTKDKMVQVKQTAAEGAGLDIVLMGDGFSDRLIADGTYDAAMNNVINAIFAEEPYKSFRDLFNVYVVYAVSENEVIGKSTAFMSYDFRTGWAGAVGAYNQQKVWAYACGASSKGDFREVIPVVILNSTTSDGAVWTTTFTAGIDNYMYDPVWDDYHGGESVAFISGPFNSDISYTTIHEIGHAFGKLADEYQGTGTIDEGTRSIWDLLCVYGMYKNIDFTGNFDVVKWKHFLSDERYSGSGLGCYEGAATFSYGVWRPSENSIMRNDANGHYNAPSREAIYYRIHKLAYGKDWDYDFEDFVQWDNPNLQQRTRLYSKSVPYPARIDKLPILKIEESLSSNGKKSHYGDYELTNCSN